MRNKISVILCVRNGENYLAEAIVSSLNQDYEEKEVIVVNDGSTDGTERIIAQFGKKILSIYQDHRGLGAARNAGVQVSTGDYLAFLDHDDLWVSSKIRIKMREMVLDKEEEPLIFSHLEQFICPTLNEEEKKRLRVDSSIMPGYLAGTLLISKKRFFQVGPFFEKIEVGEFLDWYLRAKELKVPLRIIPEVTLYRRVHRENMGRRGDLYSQNFYLRILKADLDRRRALV